MKHAARIPGLALVLSIAPVLACLYLGCGISLIGAEPEAGSNDASGDDAREGRDDGDAAPDADAAADARIDDGGGASDGTSMDADADSGPITTVTSTVRASTSLTVDHVRSTDGAITADGTGDGEFVVEITGPAVAVALLRTNADGDPTGFQQWDTWVGTDGIPFGVGAGYVLGLATYQLGVFEGGVRLNDATGRATIPAGPHSLRVFASNVGSFVSGNSFRVVVEDANHALVRGPVVTY